MDNPPAECLAPAVPDAPASHAEQLAIFQAVLKTIQHFFGGLAALLADVSDPRDPRYVRYPLPALLCTGVMMFLCHLGSRRQINHLLRGNAAVAAKFRALFGVASCPHGDTLNVLCQELVPEQLQAAVSNATARLIRQKVLYPYRLRERWYVVGIDGTETLVFAQPHCEHDLSMTHGEQTRYYHKVLEAKLLAPNGFALSLMTEFIENSDPKPDKQDCEQKGFTRLSESLHRRFPRLPLCLSLDALYATGPTFARCAEYHWKYLVVLKDKDLPKVCREFEALCALSPGEHLELVSGPHGEVQQSYRWANDIGYEDSAGRVHTLSVIACRETKPGTGGQSHTTVFKWVTNFKVKAKNVQELANQGGRIRWKEENEGFNTQKHGGFALEHAYSLDENAGKILYFLLQLAHLLEQLVAHGSLLRQAFPNGVGSVKNIAYRLLEAWRNLELQGAELDRILHSRCQIRFDSS